MYLSVYPAVVTKTLGRHYKYLAFIEQNYFFLNSLAAVQKKLSVSICECYCKNDFI